MKNSLKIVGLISLCIVIVSCVIGLAGYSWAINKPVCIKDSQEKSGFIKSAPCGVYGMVSPREDVVVQYMVHKPEGLQKALVVLFSGGNGDTGIIGDPVTGQVLAANHNFLVRSAQLFAKDHYLAVTIDRPLRPDLQTPESDGDGFDAYRLSEAHGIDITAVLSEVNPDNLPVFLAGTSLGVLSSVAQSHLDLGIAGVLLSSPVTLRVPGKLYLGCSVSGNPDCAKLQPEHVEVPVHVLAHEWDGCIATSPEGSEALHDDFVSAGVDSVFDEVTGGFTWSDDPCQARTYHGFLGIENEAVKKITKRMDEILKTIWKK